VAAKKSPLARLVLMYLRMCRVVVDERL